MTPSNDGQVTLETTCPVTPSDDGWEQLKRGQLEVPMSDLVGDPE
jgi:hypothetical protein